MSHRYALETEEADPARPHRGAAADHRRAGAARQAPRPLFFRDGSLVYHRVNNDEAPGTCGSTSRPASASCSPTSKAAGRPSPTPDGRALIFQRINYLPLAWRIAGDSHVNWNDLFRLDLESGAIRPLTRGYRAHEPDVSPDGSQIACVVDADGRPPAGAGSHRRGRAARADARRPGFAYTPAFSPDGRLIAYSRWKPGGFRDIHIYDLPSGTDRALFVDRAMDVDPRFTPDGRFLLFASDRTGIYDVYAHELATARLYQVTNVADGRVPARGLSRRHEADLHRLLVGRIRPVRDAVQSRGLRWRSRSPTRGPTIRLTPTATATHLTPPAPAPPRGP